MYTSMGHEVKIKNDLKTPTSQSSSTSAKLIVRKLKRDTFIESSHTSDLRGSK
jgi:hypothetical protein